LNIINFIGNKKSIFKGTVIRFEVIETDQGYNPANGNDN